MFWQQLIAATVRHVLTATGTTVAYENANSDPKTAIVGGVFAAIGLGLSYLNKKGK